MTSTEPAVLFVHGSWHTPVHFQPVQAVFEAAGYPTSCPLLPSFGQLPPMGVERKDVIVVAHSYGGVVSTQAVDAAFAKAHRQANGEKGGVLHILYMCAFLLPLGASLETALGGALPPFIPVDEQGMCVMLEPERRFHNDISEDEKQRWLAENKPCPAIAQQTPITQAAYLYHPVTYLYCEGDAALPLAVQQMMVQRAKGDSGIQIGEGTCSAGHSPYLSQPEKVLETVRALKV